MEDNFFITLLSNSSMNYNPENTTSHFTVNLPKEINLEGKWSVAISEITYPNLIANVTDGSNQMTVFCKTYYQSKFITCSRKMRIDNGIYPTIEDVIKGINEKFMSEYKTVALFESTLDGGRLVPINPVDVFLSVRETTQIYLKPRLNPEVPPMNSPNFEIIHSRDAPADPEEARYQESEDLTVTFDGRLGLQLGYVPSDKQTVKIVKNKALLPRSTPVHNANILLGYPPEILVYIDIIEPQLISDSCSQVARIVKTFDSDKASIGGLVSHEFTHRDYLPLLKNCFQAIRVELRDATGKHIPFAFGTSCVKLHFKKCS